MSLQTLPQYETYKDSGIEWLGKIPEHWQTKKVKFLFFNDTVFYLYILYVK